MRYLSSKLIAAVITASCISFAMATASIGQNVNVTTPFGVNTDSYYENFGVNFGFSFPGGQGNGARVVGLSPNGQLLPNVTFFQGGSLGVNPPFGGFDPNSGGRFGFNSIGSNGGGYSLGFNFAKGSNRTSVSTSPSLTVQNGFGGSMSSGEIRPFVTGVVPFVGDGYQTQMPIDNGVTRAINSGQLDLSKQCQPQERLPSQYSGPIYNADSSATQGDLSVASIKAERQRKLDAQHRLLNEKLSEAQQLVDEQKFSSARTKFREALQLADNEKTKREIKAQIESTRTK